MVHASLCRGHRSDLMNSICFLSISSLVLNSSTDIPGLFGSVFAPGANSLTKHLAACVSAGNDGKDSHAHLSEEAGSRVVRWTCIEREKSTRLLQMLLSLNHAL